MFKSDTNLVINTLPIFTQSYSDKIYMNFCRFSYCMKSMQVTSDICFLIPGFYFSTPSFTTSPTWTFSWTLIKLESIMAMRSAIAL